MLSVRYCKNLKEATVRSTNSLFLSVAGFVESYMRDC